ncbi:MAG: membrane protein insertase YidC [Thermodesulfobacteriota bacterium]
MEKNALIAIVVSFLVIFVYYTFFVPVPPKKEEPVDKKAAVPRVLEQPPSPFQPFGPFSPTAPAPAPASRAEAAGRKITLETNTVIIVFDSQGATPISWKLKGYKDKPGKQGKLLDLISPQPSSEDEFLLRVTWPGVLETNTTRLAYYTDSQDQILEDSGRKVRVAFSFEIPNRVRIDKTYELVADGFAVDFRLDLTNLSQQPLTVPPIISLTRGLMGDKDMDMALAFVAFADGKVAREKLKKPGHEPLVADKLTWLGIDEKYFLAALLPRPEGQYRVDVERTASGLLAARVAPVSFQLAANETKSLNFKIFFGPKDIQVLRSLQPDLDQAIDFGWFKIFAKPLLLVLRFFNGFVNNFGWSIILLTLAIKILFWPLTHKSFHSMQRMQKLQPFVSKIREQYKNDKARLNREIMGLYRRHKVNPLGGCLPMLIQLPVLYAMYRTFLSATELRHAPFILWISDLSAKDPTYITPILMGGTMFLQQKMTPTMGDPSQAKMMLMMPVIFTVMFLNFPSGLVLYWLVSNVLSIAQQYYINKKMAHIPLPAAETKK